jgi:hypothetical protein
MWANLELPDLPHQCVIRFGEHVMHACHCGATRRVTDAEHVAIAVQAAENARARRAHDPQGHR